MGGALQKTAGCRLQAQHNSSEHLTAVLAHLSSVKVMLLDAGATMDVSDCAGSFIRLSAASNQQSRQEATFGTCWVFSSQLHGGGVGVGQQKFGRFQLVVAQSCCIAHAWTAECLQLKG